MSMVDVFALCEKVTEEAFRLETRQRYNVRYEQPLVRAFAGEEILIADRAWHPDLAELTEDFMLLDGDTGHASVVWYRYSDDDELLARDHSHDPADIGICRRHRDLAVAHAIPYAAFMQGVNLA